MSIKPGTCAIDSVTGIWRDSSVLIWPSAEAELTASGIWPPKVMAMASNKPGAPAENSGCGAIQVVITTGNDISSTVRPTIAGLNTFWPMPPKECLAMAMAKIAPSTPIHQGAQGGKLIASNQPVSSAEQSASVAITGLPASDRQPASITR